MYWQWWEKEGQEIGGDKDRVAAASDGEEVQYGEGAVQEEMPGQE